MPASHLADSDLPPLYRAADGSSLDAQAKFLFATRLRLCALVWAAAFGILSWTNGPGSTDWAGVLAAGGFFVSLSVECYLLREKPDRTWYEGRAVAESVKTLAWRYAVGGSLFAVNQTPADADRLFLQQLDGLLDVVRHLSLTAPISSDEQISVAMKSLRASSLVDRKAAYERGRVVDQQEWYRRKAAWNKQRADRWTVAMLVIELGGLIAAVLKAAGVIVVDLLGLGAAIVASVTAWVQTKQHGTLATAYSVTVLELASVRSKIEHQSTEAEWAAFVDDAEEAFSREHTLWKASRGVRSLGS